MADISWQDKIEKYCDDFNLPLYYLSETLNDPKVIPMIRGKAFEYTVLERIENILTKKIWKVTKPFLNPQLGFHDSDVQIEHIETGIKINIECKLAAKGKVRTDEANNTTSISIKCMRSRTLGEKMVKSLAPALGVSENQLMVHNDQYTPKNFDFVITSIGNAFYETNEEGKFVFSPNMKNSPFLANFPGIDLKKETFNTLYIAKSEDISISEQNKVTCTRKACDDKENCGFIPNYPEIKFKNTSIRPINNWHLIEEIDVVVHNYLSEITYKSKQ